MSSFLSRLGHTVARRAKAVLALWALLIVAMSTLAVGLGGQLQDDLSIPGTESQRGLDTLNNRFPELAGTSGQILFVAPEGQQVTAYAGQVGQVLDTVKQVEHVQIVTDPFTKKDRAISLSQDGRDALVQVLLDVPLDRLDPATVAALEEAAQLPQSSDLDVHLGGSIFTNTQVTLSPTEAVGVLVAMLVLALTFGSMLAAGMPILTALIGVAVAMTGLLSVAAVTDVNTSTPSLALMIGLAVGIDYALFIVSRHRTQLAAGLPVEESIARTLATSGSAVIFAGATVVIALCGLVVARIPFLAVMGYAAAAAVAIAVAVALTVVPALLALAGERLRPRPGSRAARNASAEADGRRTLGARWVALVTRIPALTAVLTIGVLLVLAVPAKDLALGLPDNGTADRGTTERTTYDLISRDFGPGFNAPLLVTVDIIRTTDPVGVMTDMGRDIGRLDGVRAIALATPNRTGDLGVVQVLPEGSQTDRSTADLVQAIRDARSGLERKYDATELAVTGQTAVTIDVSQRLRDALLPFALVVIGLSLLLLMMVFRSIAVPIKATLGYLFSVGASFGAVTVVFQYGWFAEALNVAKVGPVISFLPIILMGVLFGLAMDYEVFLVSRMREEYVHTRDAKRAVTAGFTASARVVGAAAIIMISVFAAFVPHSDLSVKPVALGLAVGVFVDAFLVRMTLVPAVLTLLGDKAWWLPQWLDRRLPVLDVEGVGLQHQVEHQDWTRLNGPALVRAENVSVPDLLEPVSLLVREPGIVVVASTDRAARRALLAALTGRLDVDGRLVVLDRVLPDEAAVLRRAVALLERFPSRADLGRVAAAPLVVVDDVDDFASPDEVVRRWETLVGLVDAGTTVVAGVHSASSAPEGLSVVRLIPVQTPENVL